MPWTKAHDVTAADVDTFEQMLDDIAEADRHARHREAYNLHLGWDHAEANPQPIEAHHD